MSRPVLIVGAGPAGLAAAVAAGESGARVQLVDDNPAPGGQIWRRDLRRGAATAASPYLNAIETLRATGQLELLDGTTIVDAESPSELLATRQGTKALHRLRW